jgi:microcystin degradation protein MlrC
LVAAISKVRGATDSGAVVATGSGAVVATDSGAVVATGSGAIVATGSGSLIINVNSDAPITFDPSIFTVMGVSSHEKTIIVLLLKIKKINILNGICFQECRFTEKIHIYSKWHLFSGFL